MKYTEKDLAKNLTEPIDFDDEIISQLKKEGNKDILDSFTKQGRAKMIAETLDYLHLLSTDLQNIVDAELKLGNKVMSAGKDYPEKGSINVT